MPLYININICYCAIDIYNFPINKYHGQNLIYFNPFLIESDLIPKYMKCTFI